MLYIIYYTLYSKLPEFQIAQKDNVYSISNRRKQITWLNHHSIFLKVFTNQWNTRTFKTKLNKNPGVHCEYKIALKGEEKSDYEGIYIFISELQD